MKNYYKFLVLITFAFFTYACSNNPLHNNDQSEETTNESSPENIGKNEYDFRKTKWGMSKEEVKNTEQGEIVFESDKKIDYHTTMMGVNSKIGYTFRDDELIRASSFFSDEHNTNDEYIEQYEVIKKALKKQYGRTVIDTIQQKDPSMRIDPDKTSDAVCNGELLYAAQWDLPGSDVQLLLRGENSKCILSILYISEEAFRQIMEGRENKDIPR